MEEFWRDVPGYEGAYRISSKGRLRSFKFGKFWRVNKGTRTSNGYIHYCLSKNGSSKLFLAHRLVMLAFKGPSELSVDHINGVRTDNRLENLEYVTLRENSRRGGERNRTKALPSGVYEFRDKYRVYKHFNGKGVLIGYFDNIEEAGRAYYHTSEKDAEALIRQRDSKRNSPDRGVWFDSARNKWVGERYRKNKRFRTRRFNTKKEAVEAINVLCPL